MKKIEITIFFFFSLLFVFPIFLHIKSTFPRLDSDYNAVLGIYEYIGNFVRVHHSIPSIVPFVGKGISVVGDPLNAIFDPFFSLPIIFFGINMGIRIAIFINAWLSMITMLLFLKKLQVKQYLQYLGSIAYGTSGVFTASVAAGHITEKFLTYPLIPLFFMLSMQKKMTIRILVGIGMIFATTVYCGDLYALWFFGIFLIVIRSFFFFQEKINLKELIYICVPGALAIVFASPKLFFFTHDVLPIMQRTNIVNPFLGSINAMFFPLQFLIPFQVNFYDRPFFQRIFGFYYNWYEYYAFIGILPIFFLKNIKLVFTNTYTKLFIISLFVGAFYVANNYWYSPFHYIFLFVKPIDVFRVPQRIAIPLTGAVIALICMCANTWKNKSTVFALMSVTIFWTISIGWFTFSRTFVPISKNELQFTSLVRKIDVQKHPVLLVDAGSEYLLSKVNIPVANYYYGWVPRKTPIVFIDNHMLNKKVIYQNKTQFILASTKYSFKDIGYMQLGKVNNEIVWGK